MQLGGMGFQSRKSDSQKELAQVTLASIGDGVVTTDAETRITFLNPVAERLTGWDNDAARGRLIGDVMHLVNEETGAPAANPVDQCRAQGVAVNLAKHTVLQTRAGGELAIEDSAAPILDKDGRLTGVVMVFHDVSEQRAMTREMAWQVAHDSLTGLTNRREFERRVQALIACPAPGVRHALLFLDLDQFKIVNDTCGHLAGDDLLKRLALMLQGQVRGGDVLARLGGDEFGVLLENCSLDQAREIAEKLRKQVREFEFFWQEKRFEVGVSIGVTPIDAATSTIAEATAAADMACYAAKEHGRNRIHVHAPGDQDMERRHKKLHVAGGIRAALEENHMVLFGQEIRSIRGDSQGHFEVLLRLRGEDGTLQPPALFIPAAERYGLMGEVDRWVVRNAFQFLAQHPHMHLAINLSGRSLQDESFASYITQMLTSHNIDASHICFEITETSAITHIGHAIAFIRDLKTWGFRFSLDDFGAGMSSFAYLKNLPVDYLKIDGVFVRDIVSDPIDRAFVETINRIGQVMGMETIAEFVESEAILRELERIGVDYAQGFGIAKPAPLDSLAR
jgi:diguanylate cyclase (GGDEF)-like protein/PAS domain S-box-containing protein